MRDVIRSCTFRPYRAKGGPSFRLTMYEVPGYAPTGQKLVGYRLLFNGKVLFEGKEYGVSPLHAEDSDEAVAGLMSFLCMRPGDTDAEYFEKYTPEQLEFCTEYAEALWLCVEDRFGEDACF